MSNEIEKEIQKSILASILTNPNCFEDVAELVCAEDFTTSHGREIFSCVQELRSLDQTVDLFSVIDKIGREEQITALFSSDVLLTPMSAAAVLQKKSFKRRAISLLKEAIERVSSSDSIDEQLSIVHSISEGLEVKTDDVVSFRELMKDAFKRLDDRTKGIVERRLKTGFSMIDERITGFAPSDLIIIAGRPAMGKTTYAMNIAENVSIDGGNVAVFSLEMSKQQLVDRMLSSLSGVEAYKIKSGKGFTADDWPKLGASQYKIKKMMPTIIDKPAIHIDHMTNICRKLNKQKKLDLVVVDYLQLMTASANNRFEEISAISRGLKALAKTLDCPVVALSQLNRSVDSRTNNRPVMSDLRESGQIEQDADLIQFLYRDEVYNENSECVGICEVITAKFRSGEAGTDRIKSELKCNRFVNLPDHYQPPAPKKAYSYGK